MGIGGVPEHEGVAYDDDHGCEAAQGVELIVAMAPVRCEHKGEFITGVRQGWCRMAGVRCRKYWLGWKSDAKLEGVR
jgi:hypothetical protein